MIIRSLDPTDNDMVTKLFYACGDDWHRMFGVPPTENDFQSAYMKIPEGASYDQKKIEGLVDDDALVAYLDLVTDYPTPTAASIGFALTHPRFRRRSHALNLLSVAARKYKVASFEIAIIPGSDAEAFAVGIGFTTVENRNGHPVRTGKLP